MKLRHLLIGMLAIAAAVSCKEEEPQEVPSLSVDKSSLSLLSEGAEASFSLTTNQDWTATPDAEWLNVEPASGKGSAQAVTITVTAEDNTAAEARTATIKIKAGALAKSINVTQAEKGGTVEPEPEPGPGDDKPTIKAFMTEYVKLIDVYEKTVGTVNYMSKEGVADPTADYGVASIENAHYIPADTKVRVSGTTYSIPEAYDIAMRTYLLLRGYDANNETVYGAGSFSKLAKALTVNDAFLPARSYVYGDYPYNESGRIDEQGNASGNGGPLKMGVHPDGVDKVKVDLLDNFAERNSNWPAVVNSNAISNLSGYTKRNDCPGYYGCACAMRMVLTYAYVFKYILDNELTDATAIPADYEFTTSHFRVDNPAEPETPAFEAGAYWIMGTKDNATKVMQPLVDKNYGYAPSEDAVEGKSYAKNVFTFTAVDGGFTIKDVNGKFYYQEKNTTYKTFNVGTDGTLAGCVWTVTKNADDTYAIVNKESGKTIRFAEGTYTSFGVYTDAEANGSVLVNLVKADSPLEDKPAEPEQPAVDVPWTLGEASYSDVATINGVANVPVLKLGKSDAVGNATIKIPAGTTTAKFSAVAWKNKSTKITFTAEGLGTIHEVTLKGNDGATGTAPYTITTDGSEVQNINVYALVANINNGTPAPLPIDLVVTVTTDATNYRAILWGFEFGTDIPSAPEQPKAATIKDFATEYVKLIDVWQANVGTVNYLKGVGEAGDAYDMYNAHYIPENTKVTVDGKEYNLADVLELAERSYLLVRGWDGNNTTGGKGTFPTIEGTSMDTELSETHNYAWGTSPYNETGKTEAGNKVTGNGGGFRMGDPNTLDGVEAVKLDVLDNFAQRHLNYPIKNSTISNMCGYSTGQLAGYYGCFSAKRALLTYAYFFKYMLDNNLADAKSISADQTFNTYLFGPDATAEKPEPEPESFFADDFSWVAPWADKYGSDDSVGTDNSSGKAPNVYTQETHLENGVSEGYPAFLTVFAEKGYEDINPTVKSFYTQKYYLKFGKTSAHTGIKLPAIDFKTTSAVDATISFDWCAHMTGSGNIDKVQIVVEVVGDGVCADSNAKVSLPVSHTQEKGDLKWQNVKVSLKGVTSSSRIIIRPTHLEDHDDVTQQRWHLDNVKVY